MQKHFLATLAVAAGLAVTGLSAAPANALTVSKPGVAAQSDVVQVRRGGRHFGGPRFGGPRFGHRHRGFGRGFRYGFYGLPAYSYGYYGGGGCQWLRHRAIRTGSGYWWRRYNDCRYGY